MKRLLSIILAAAAAIAFFMLPVSAAENVPIEWDGETALLSGNTYIISQPLKISGELTVPENAKLTVKSGGELKIVMNTAVNVLGSFNIAIGGLVINSGRFTLADTGEMNVYGEFRSSISAILKLKGRLTIYNQGIFKSSSQNSFFNTSRTFCKGRLTFLKSSETRISGEVNITERGEVHFQGMSAVTVSGFVDNYGYISVGKLGTLKISGKVIMRRKSDYNRFGTAAVTLSGTLEDNRDAVSYAKMTVATLVDEPDAHLRGIDVSFAQNDIDWEKVAASGIDFAIIRAGRGNTNISPMKADDFFVKNVTEATACGIDVGVYFYSYAETVAEAEAEARFFISLLDGYKITYPVVLDMEEEFQAGLPGETLTKMIDAFFKVVMDEGYYPMFYSYKSWMENNLDMRILDKYAVWLAQIAPYPSYDGAFYMWQYSYSGRVNGISGDVDLDISYRDFPSIFRKNGLNRL